MYNGIKRRCADGAKSNSPTHRADGAKSITRCNASGKQNDVTN